MKMLARLGMAMGIARRFVAGTTLTEAIDVVRELNRKKLEVTLDVLGENVSTIEEVTKARKSYEDVLRAIKKHKLRSHISIKLTMLGLDLGEDIAYTQTAKLLLLAKKLGIFVRIDMEGSLYTQKTLNVFYRLREKYPNVGIVLQAYLRRTDDDVNKVIAKQAPVRLVKGAYKEPASVAFELKEEVNENYRRQLEKLLLKGYHVAIATHDTQIIAHAKVFIKKHRIPSTRYEFQMLYGIRRDLQLQLVKEGYKMRVYVPFGEQYIPYFMRRLRERKENVYFVLENLLKN